MAAKIKYGKLSNFGEIATSKIDIGSNVAYMPKIEGMYINSADQSLSARNAMKYITELNNQGETKDVFTCPIRRWDLVFTNMSGDIVLLEIFNKKTNVKSDIYISNAKISTFSWVDELGKGVFKYTSSVNSIVGDSVIFIGGINRELLYLDDELILKNWRILITTGSTARYVTPIVEDFDVFQNRLSILARSGFGGVTKEDELGTNTPWIYLSQIGVFDNFQQTGAADQAVYIKPLNYEMQYYYSITAFRNILAIIHDGGLSVAKADSASDKDSLTQTNLLYYLADGSVSLPVKAVNFNNILIYLSKTGLRGRTLLEDPLTNQMTGFKIPVASKRFKRQPRGIFQKKDKMQLCIYDGNAVFSFCEMVTTTGGGQLFPRTTYIESNDDIKILAINESAGVFEINGARFLVNDTEEDVLAVGLITNFYPKVDVLDVGTDEVLLDIDDGIEKIIMLVTNTWYKLVRIESTGYFKFMTGQIPEVLGPEVSIIPIEGKNIKTLLPPAMRSDYYQWHFILNGRDCTITGDDVSIALDEDYIIVSGSKISAYSLSINIYIVSTSTQYGQTNAMELYLISDNKLDEVSTFNKVPKLQTNIDYSFNEYGFNMLFSPKERMFNLKITPNLGATDELSIEQICFSYPG